MKEIEELHIREIDEDIPDVDAILMVDGTWDEVDKLTSNWYQDNVTRRLWDEEDLYVIYLCETSDGHKFIYRRKKK